MKLLFASGMIVFLFLFCLCQFYFYVKNKIKLNNSKGVFMFINDIFFLSSVVTNSSSLFFMMSCVMGVALAWEMHEPFENIISYCIGLLGMTLWFLHCRFFCASTSNSSEFAFLREFFLKKELSQSTFFIWMARLCYLCCFIVISN